MSQQPGQEIAVAITGASGAAYAIRLVEQLVHRGEGIYLMISKPGQVVLSMESNFKLSSRPMDIQRLFSQRVNAAEGQIRVFGTEEWTAPVASGSGAPRAMVVCPCTMGTLANIAQGNCVSLIDRAADVIIKEAKKLILVPRETPFSAIHLENMLKLARLGVVILPPNPGFYSNPQSLNDMIDFVVARILDQLQISNDLSPRWGLG